jgi:hypothetical protein
LIAVTSILAAGCRSDSEVDTSVLLTLNQPGQAEQQRLVNCPGWEACPELLEISDQELAPVPEGQPCTMIYGGDLRAYLSGTLRGEEINASYSLNNGCEIERWEQVAPLFETVFGPGASSSREN